jgi:hypothetical protein
VADGDDATDVDVDESSFLTGVTSIEGVEWSGASGVDVGSLARALVGTAVFTVAVGVNTVVSGLTAAVTGLIDGVSEFLAGTTEWIRFPGVGWRSIREAGLIEVIFGTGIAAIRGAWSFNVDTFGPLSVLVALAVLLGTFLVVSRGIEQIQEVIR